MRDAHHYETTVDVRYADLDEFGYLNNAVHVTLCEEARLGYVRDVLDVDFDDAGFVVAHQELDYYRPLTTPEPVEVTVDVTGVGESTITLAYDLRHDGDRLATAETVLVFVDDDGNSRPVPDRWREVVDHGGTDA